MPGTEEPPLIKLMRLLSEIAQQPLSPEQESQLLAFRAGLIGRGDTCRRARHHERERCALIAEKYDCFEAALEIRRFTTP